MAYKEEFRISLVREYERGMPVEKVAQKFNVPRNSIYRWIREYQAIGTSTIQFTPKEFSFLRQHDNRLSHIIDIINLSGLITSATLRKRLGILEEIHNSHPEYSVHELCEALNVDRGTFYNHIFRRADTTWRDEKEKVLMQTVQQIYEDSDQRYGAERITRTMCAAGVHITKQHVLDIMHELGIESMRQEAKRNYMHKRETHTNMIRRNFSVNKPNKVWVSDITHYKCGNKHFFICAIIDLYSRKVVAYKLANHESKQLVNSALKEAIAIRKPEAGLIFHSDRGGQYVSLSLMKILAEHGFEQSFSASGKPYDNAVAEAFFSTLKKEELYRHDYRSINEFKRSVGQYIEYYNSVRTHSYLGYLSPNKFEEKHHHKKDNE